MRLSFLQASFSGQPSHLPLFVVSVLYIRQEAYAAAQAMTMKTITVCIVLYLRIDTSVLKTVAFYAVFISVGKVFPTTIFYVVDRCSGLHEVTVGGGQRVGCVHKWRYVFVFQVEQSFQHSGDLFL